MAKRLRESSGSERRKVLAEIESLQEKVHQLGQLGQPVDNMYVERFSGRELLF
jgi:hypothetical protein